MIINAPRPGCCDEACDQTRLRAGSGYNDQTRPNRAAVTAKQDAGWRPAAAMMIIMHQNQGALTGKRGAGWQPAVATQCTQTGVLQGMWPNRVRAVSPQRP